MSKTLRSELAAHNPELYSALENSTKIALTQWLPNVSQNMDSYNSYPHILGIEYHLNDILYRDNIQEHMILLNSTEIYVLCSTSLIKIFPFDDAAILLKSAVLLSKAAGIPRAIKPSFSFISYS